MTNISRSTALVSFFAGYFIVAALISAVFYLIGHPFGYGYVTGELTAAYFGWYTISNWEYLQEQFEALYQSQQ